MKFSTFILSERFEKAFCFAVSAHRNQTRKNIPSPYMTHLFAVTSMVCENIGFICDDPQKCEEYAMIAMLHDTIEDQGGNDTYNRLIEAFGQFVADGVLALSDCIPENGIKPPKAERNAEYLKKLQAHDLPIVLISCCDKIHNLNSMFADSLVLSNKAEFWNAFSASPTDTIANYRRLGETYANRLGDQRIVKIYQHVLDKVVTLLP